MLAVVKSLFSGFSELWAEQGVSHALVMNVLDEALFSVLILPHDSCSYLQPFLFLFTSLFEVQYTAPSNFFSSSVSSNPAFLPTRIPPKGYMI